jgi:hypothetical protein
MTNNKQLARGFRNNNPLNIEHSNNEWKGMAEVQTDERFVQFKDIVWGIRAAFRTLHTYRHRWRCLTLRQIISRWCPPKEKGNNTEAYIKFVARKCNLNPDELLPSTRTSETLWCNIVKAMIQMECGRDVHSDRIHEAWRRAFEPCNL